MTATIEGAGQPVPSFYVPELRDTKATVAPELCAQYHEINTKRGLPDLFTLPGIGKAKHHRVAVVGGGPSASEHADDIFAHETIIACGSAHQFFVDHVCHKKQGRAPDFATSCDGHPSAKKYVQYQFPHTTYLLATNCEPALFDLLRCRNVMTWLNHAAVFPEPEGKCISGGSTITSRSINMAIAMGFYGIDVYGFDLSYRGDVQHAYDTPGDEDTNPTVAMVDGCDRFFYTSHQFFKESQYVREMWINFWHAFDIKIHGDGMLPELFRQLSKESN